MDPELSGRIIASNERVGKWITDNGCSDILDIVPFNPMVARKAIDEIGRIDNIRNFRHVASLFKVDPGLQGRFLKYSRRLLDRKGKHDQRLRNLEHAVSVLGVDDLMKMLQYVVSDEIITALSRSQLAWPWMHLLWKEAWGMAYAAEALAPLAEYDEVKAFQTGILADLGMLLMAQLYRHDFFSRTDPLLQQESDDPYGVAGEQRPVLETAAYGITHAELSCWALAQFGLDEEYLSAALFHEADDPPLDARAHRNHRLPLILNTARRLARYGLMTDKFHELTKTEVETPERAREFLIRQEVFERRRLRARFALQDLLLKRFSIFANDAARIVDQIPRKMDLQTREISGKISAIDADDFQNALRQLASSKPRAFQLFRSLLEQDLDKALPLPVAVRYGDLVRALKRRSPDPGALVDALGALVVSFARVSFAVLVGFLYRHRELDDKVLAQELCRVGEAEELTAGQVVLGSERGASVAVRLAQRLLVYESESGTSRFTPFARFVVTNWDAVSHMLAQFTRGDNDRRSLEDVRRSVNAFATILRDFTRFRFDFRLASSVSHDSQDADHPLRWHVVSWMGSQPFHERDFTVFRPESGARVDTAEFGTLLHLIRGPENRGEWIQIRDFLIRVPGRYSRHERFFYGPDLIHFDVENARRPVRVRLTPLIGSDDPVREAYWWPTGMPDR